MISNGPDDHRLQFLTKTSTKSRKRCKDSFSNSKTCWHGWNFIWISANNFEGSEESNRVWYRSFSISCEAMLSDNQGVYKQIITGDESCIYAYDPETNDQSSEYRLKGETIPKRPKSFENQCDADSFLRLSWCCALRIPSNWPTCQQGILFKRLAWSYYHRIHLI